VIRALIAAIIIIPPLLLLRVESRERVHATRSGDQSAPVYAVDLMISASGARRPMRRIADRDHLDARMSSADFLGLLASTTKVVSEMNLNILREIKIIFIGDLVSHAKN
jgi:hypothetical protein